MTIKSLLENWKFFEKRWFWWNLCKKNWLFFWKFFWKKVQIFFSKFKFCFGCVIILTFYTFSFNYDWKCLLSHGGFKLLKTLCVCALSHAQQIPKVVQIILHNILFVRKSWFWDQKILDSHRVFHFLNLRFRFWFYRHI